MSQSDEPLISVLVADDEEDQRALIEGFLRHAKGTRHVVTSVADGPSALTAVREQVFDVALLDLSMPGLDGLEVLEAVAGDPSRPQVVFVSGRGTVETATRAMKLGAFDFLEKPVDPDRLITVTMECCACATGPFEDGAVGGGRQPRRRGRVHPDGRPACEGPAPIVGADRALRRLGSDRRGVGNGEGADCARTSPAVGDGTPSHSSRSTARRSPRCSLSPSCSDTRKEPSPVRPRERWA